MNASNVWTGEPPPILFCEMHGHVTSPATHWMIQWVDAGELGDHSPALFEAIAVCDECTPRVASGDQPDKVVAVTPIHLLANVEQI